MDTIAVIGTGERALRLLATLAESRFEVISVSTSPARVAVELRRRLPVTLRASWLAEARFVDDLDELLDCSIVIEAVETDDLDGRRRALRLFEAHLSEGAVLVTTSEGAEDLAMDLARPTQFVGLAGVDRVPTPRSVDDTAPGALFAVERLCEELGRGATIAGERPSSRPAPALAAV